MKALILMGALLPVAAQAAPMDLVEIQKETYARVISARQDYIGVKARRAPGASKEAWGVNEMEGNWYAKSYRVAGKDEVIWGNCSDHAATARALLKEAGYTDAKYMVCAGGRHVFTVSHGWAFDSRFLDRVVPASTAVLSCEGKL